MSDNLGVDYEELNEAVSDSYTAMQIMKATAEYFAWKQSLTWYDKLWIWLKGTRLT